MPFKNGSLQNLAMTYTSDSLDVCKEEATKLANEIPKATFFFWSSSPNPLEDSQISLPANCYVLKKCTNTERTTLRYPGNTYQVQECKSNYTFYKNLTRFASRTSLRP